MPRIKSQDFFLSELAKVFIEEKSLSKLSAFFYESLKFTFRAHLHAFSKSQLSNFGYSIVKQRKGAN